MPASEATTTPGSARRAESAWGSRAAWVWMLAACVLSIVIDLGSKELAFAKVADAPVRVRRADVLEIASTYDPRAISDPDRGIIPRHAPVVVVPGALNFQLVLNPGAVFGMGPGKRAFFVGFTIIALGFGLLMFARWTGPRDHFAHAAIGLLIGGGLGNLYDRLALACVRDFIHPLPGMRWPFGWTLMGNREVWPYVSNLADLFLLIGIVMLLAHLWRRDRAANASPQAPLPAADS